MQIIPPAVAGFSTSFGGFEGQSATKLRDLGRRWLKLPNGGAGVEAKSKGGGGCSEPDSEVDPEGNIEAMVKALGSSSGGGRS